MVTSTLRRTPSSPTETPPTTTASARARPQRPLRREWGYSCAAGLSVLTLWSLFQPWLTASGPRGMLSSTAFGRLDGTLSGSNSNVGVLPGSTDTSISGTMAILTAFTAFTTVVSVVLWLRTRNELLAAAVEASAAATALCVASDLLYLNGKAPQLRGLTEGKRHADPLGTLAQLFLGDTAPPPESYHIATASLTTTAMLGGACAFGSVLCALASGRILGGQAVLTQRAPGGPGEHATEAESWPTTQPAGPLALTGSGAVVYLRGGQLLRVG